VLNGATVRQAGKLRTMDHGEGGQKPGPSISTLVTVFQYSRLAYNYLEMHEWISFHKLTEMYGPHVQDQ